MKEGSRWVNWSVVGGTRSGDGARTERVLGRDWHWDSDPSPFTHPHSHPFKIFPMYVHTLYVYIAHCRYDFYSHLGLRSMINSWYILKKQGKVKATTTNATVHSLYSIFIFILLASSFCFYETRKVYGQFPCTSLISDRYVYLMCENIKAVLQYILNGSRQQTTFLSCMLLTFYLAYFTFRFVLKKYILNG